MRPVSKIDGVVLAIFLASAYIFLHSDSGELVHGMVATKALWALASCGIAVQAARRLWDVPQSRWNWLGMAAGMGILALGEASFSYYQWFHGVELPFPSLADVFFLLAYPVLILTLSGFVVSYRSVLPVAGTRELAGIAGSTLLVLLVLALVATRPILEQDAPLIHRSLMAGYVWLDIGLVLPLVLLARTAFALRGGGLAWGWGFLLCGFIALETADLLFSFTHWMQASSYPYLDEVFYMASYLFIMEGMIIHRRILN